MRPEGGGHFAWSQRVGPRVSVSVGCVELESGEMSRLLWSSGLGGLAVAHQDGQTVL